MAVRRDEVKALLVSMYSERSPIAAARAHAIMHNCVLPAPGEGTRQNSVKIGRRIGLVSPVSCTHLIPRKLR